MDQVMLRPLVEGPSAWIGADLAKRPEEWTYQLASAQVAEIDAAVAGVRDRDIAEIRRADFPLPTLGPALDRLRDEVLNGRGFVLMRGLPVEGRSIAESAAAYWGIGTYLGNARSQNAKGHVLGHVRDLGLSSKDPNVRIYQTTERQNFHTDSCDIVGAAVPEDREVRRPVVADQLDDDLQRDGDAPSGPGLAAVPADADRPARRGARGQAPVVRNPGLQRAPGPAVGDLRAALRAFVAALSRGAAAQRRGRRGARLLRRAGRRRRAAARHGVPAGRHAVRAQPHDAARPHRVRGLAGAGAQAAPAAAVARRLRARGRCRRPTPNATAASRSATAAASSARARGCTRRSRRCSLPHHTTPSARSAATSFAS